MDELELLGKGKWGGLCNRSGWETARPGRSNKGRGEQQGREAVRAKNSKGEE